MRKSLAALLISILTVLVLSGFNFQPAAGVYVYDDGDFLTEAEEQAVQSAIESARETIKADILVVFTENPTAGGSQAAAEAITQGWIQSGKGYGKDQATILYYVDMDGGNIYVDEYSSKGNYKMKTGEIDYITHGNAKIHLENGNFGKAALQAVNDITDAAKPGFFQTIWGWLTTGAAGGGIATLFGKAKQSKAVAPPRRHYLREGRPAVMNSDERFMGATREVIDHTPKETPERAQGPTGEIAAGEGQKENHQGGGASFKKPEK